MRLQQTRVPGQKRRPPLPQPTAQILMLDLQDLAIVWVRPLIIKLGSSAVDGKRFPELNAS